VPTILELAGAKRPATESSSAPLPPGRSLVPAFAKDNSVSRDSLWWLQEGNRAVRVGDWKLVAAVPSLRGRGADAEKAEAGAWELYNLAEDRAETKNLAAEQPEKVRELAAVWSAKQQEFFELARAGAGEAGNEPKKAKKGKK